MINQCLSIKKALQSMALNSGVLLPGVSKQLV